MKIILIVLSLVLASGCVGRVAPGSDTVTAERQFDRQKMDNLLSLLSENNKAILSLEIVEKGKQAYQDQTGFAYYDSMGQKVKADAQTQYRVGSITKMFTATLIMQLIEQGKLSLTTPLSTFYPEIKNAQEITIDHMLMHRSGLFNYTADTGFSEYKYKPQSQAQMIVRFSSFEPNFKPGKKYSYSNTNYMLLGYIIETITGESYQTVLQKKIINKLNLKNTQLGSAIDTDKNQAQSFYFSRGDWQVRNPGHMSVAFAAGAIISNPHDLNIFSQALMSGKLVSKKSLKQMLSSNYGYGRGIARYPFNRNGRYCHGLLGLIDGFNSALLYFPEDDMSLAVSANGLALKNFNDDVVDAVLNIYYDRPYELPDFSYQIESLDEKQLGLFVGDFQFQSPRNRATKIESTLFLRNGQLFARIPDVHNNDGKALEVSFVATSDRTFFNESEGIQLTFDTTWYGSINPDRCKVTHNGIDYDFQKAN
ncbi:MAG: beta-lactamase family protein [Desulfobulbaceae bacterium]|nr:beta-lactamase family protein [Desulfobulbaceae bacterium]